MSKAIGVSNVRESKATLTRESLQELSERVRETYLSDGKPWVVGFSGGKDSTATLQFVWYALQELPPEKLTKPVYVISSDTLVETPFMTEYLTHVLDNINTAAKNQNLPLKAHKVHPALEDTFWVNMIGRGYPAPSSMFRWCTDRLKIKPTSRFIQDKIAKYGEVVIILGARRAESASRAQVIDRSHEKRGGGYGLTRHTKLTGAWIYTPIEDWTRRDVWDYLLQAPNPWGSDNKDLVTMYKNAEGECPLVVEKNTQPCGNSRFGCWTCTLVEKDKSMEAMFDGGDDWLDPLLNLRDWLYMTRDPKNKHKYRDHRRRTGKIQFMESDGNKKIIWGPYKMEIRAQILRELLLAQKSIQENSPYPDAKLITDEELHKIRQLWRFEEGDWEDSLPEIYKEVIGEEFEWLDEDWSGMGGMEKEVLKQVCEKYSLPTKMLTALLEAERKQHGMSRRAGIHAEIGRILEKDWQTLEEVIAEGAYVYGVSEEPCHAD